jgi:hypothetical protein
LQQDQVIINDPYLGGVNNDNIYITISASLQSLETGEFFGVTGADLRTDVILSAVSDANAVQGVSAVDEYFIYTIGEEFMVIGSSLYKQGINELYSVPSYLLTDEAD